MIIKSIELNNFRIYRGKNKIDLTPNGEHNIIIVSGNNGYGKTTFLMSLVWCLYGKNMDKVDELYKKEIDEKGSYSKYIGNSLNLTAADNGETRFSVSVTFINVDIPNTTCTEVTIVRSYDRATSASDELEILIDGKASDLFGDKDEEELFIRDYILPIEIAKFFFFDAEKIVSFAQVNTPKQRAELSQAYSQVLGIQKYAELKSELEKLQDDYRREAAQPQDKKEFNELLALIANAEDHISDCERRISEHQEKISLLKYECGELQEKLIREGDLMSVERLEELKGKKERCQSDVNEAQEGLKELYNYIPFALAGSILSDMTVQIKEEKVFNQNKIQLEGIEEKTDDILDELDKARDSFNGHIDIRIRNFYEKEIKRLILKHFYNELDFDKYDSFKTLHDFSDLQYDDFLGLLENIKSSKTTFESIFNKYSKAKAELFSIEKTIREAEKNAESEYIQSLRLRKQNKEAEITNLQEENARLNVSIEQKKEEIKAAKQKKAILSERIAVSAKNKDMDDEARMLILTIQKFLLRFKDEKKKALENRLKDKLTSFLHKKDLVNNVVVDIQGNGEDVDINLFDAGGKKIDKGILSMGERQMFASALLGALVEETGLDFPVFIDSPMQKFDINHSQNILAKFYPNVSKQVVLFPLLMKELTEEEYGLIERYVNKAFLIENHKTGSQFKEIKPQELFDIYKQQ
ncbi:MAG: DNA sulfur modification protein DndD [Bacteroidales bacterium]|nr:DNA sulfur modification protein DndD [Bacteroidales bacterium]